MAIVKSKLLKEIADNYPNFLKKDLEKSLNIFINEIKFALYKKENVYDIIIVLNFNMNPIVKNKGSAIFIHVAKKNYKKTEGCVAIKKVHLLKITKDLKKNTKVLIVNQK